jgi:hydrogenase maturation protease
LSVLIIGVGNPYRRDDAAGLVVARRLLEAARGSVTVREQSGEGMALIEAWEGARAVIVIDAVHSGAPAGTIYRVDAHAENIPAGWFHWSTHALNVAEAIELARALKRLPPRLIVLGIEGERFETGVGLSPQVERALDELVARALQEIERAGRGV